MDEEIAMVLSELIVNKYFNGMTYKKAFLKVVQAYQQLKMQTKTNKSLL